MMKNILVFFALTIISLVSAQSYAASFLPLSKSPAKPQDEPPPPVDGSSESEKKYKEIIDEYKKSLSSVPKEVRDEVRQFRIEIAKIQKQKRDLYRRLSVQAQEYLKNEERFRQKLPLDPKGELSAKNLKAIESSQTNR